MHGIKAVVGTNFVVREGLEDILLLTLGVLKTVPICSCGNSPVVNGADKLDICLLHPA